MANRFLNNIRINDEYTLPSSDGSADQIIQTDGAGNLSFVDLSAISGAQSNFVYFEVKNETGSTINKGKGVMAVGTDGNSGHILIDEMVADGTVEPKYFLGVLETTVANGGFARAISFGQLDQFNTNGQNGETWNDGQILWCDPDSPGDFTITEPDGPNVKIAAAFILNSSTNGKIQVRVQANEGIHDLHDTKITSQVDGDVLVWDNTTGVWFNDSTLNVDYTNGNVGIGTTSPSSELDVYGTISLNGFDGLRYDTTSQSLYAGHLAGNNQSRSNAFGYEALRFNAGRSSNGFGYLALQNNTADSSNGFGRAALQYNTGDSSNGFGYASLQNNTGGYSNGFGNAALQNNQGTNNTAIGGFAGYETTALAGDSNTFLGYNASYGANTTITNSTAVGANVTLTDSNTVILGNGANVGIGTTSPSYKLDVSGTGRFTDELTVPRLISTQTTGTAPLTVASTTLVTNLNADLLDGVQGSSFLRSDVADIAEGNIVFQDSIGLGFGNTTDTEFKYINDIRFQLALKNTDFVILDNATTRFTFGRTTGNLTLSTGDIIITNDGKGIDFANDAKMYQIGTVTALNLDGDSNSFRIYDAGVEKFQFDVTTGNFTNTGVITSSGTGNSSFAGNVGINITTPQTGLHLYDTTANATAGGTDKSILRLTNAYAGAFGSGGEIQFGLNPSTSGASVLSAIKGKYTEYTSGNYGGDLSFYTRNDDGLGLFERMTIDANGNVGIGTTAPNAQLEVVKTASGGQQEVARFSQLDGGSRGIIIYGAGAGGAYVGFGKTTSAAYAFRNLANDTSLLTIADTGNVGIGTTAPNRDLVVSDATNAHLKILSYTAVAEAQLTFATINSDTLYEKSAIIASGSGSWGRHNMHFCVNNAASSANVTLSDSRMMIDYATGNVGIGTSSPGAKLEVEQSNSGTDTVFLSDSYNNKGFRTGNAGYATFSGYQDANNIGSGGAYGALIGLNTFYNGTSFYNDNQYVDPSSILFKDGNILFYTNDISASGNFTPNERLRITKAGNVGIGTTSPNHELVVQGTSSPNIELKNSNYSNGGFVLNRANYTQQWKWWAESSQMYFSFATDESTYSAKMTIKSSGDVGIGTASPSYKLDVTGDGRVTGDFRCDTLIQTSDSDLKDNIKDISLAKSNIRFKEYTLKNDNSCKKKYGVLADDIINDYPELVHYNAQGQAGVDYISLLVKKVAELEEENNKLQEQINEILKKLK